VDIRRCYFFFAGLLAPVFVGALAAAFFLVALTVLLAVLLAAFLDAFLAVFLALPVACLLPLPVFLWLSTDSAALSGADASLIPLALRYKIVDIQ